jgi:hypothetical protein
MAMHLLMQGEARLADFSFFWVEGLTIWVEFGVTSEVILVTVVTARERLRDVYHWEVAPGLPHVLSEDPGDARWRPREGGSVGAVWWTRGCANGRTHPDNLILCTKKVVF